MQNNPFGFIKISGEGAKVFLQGQLTCHMDELSTLGNLAAHCNPQGRVMSLFKIYHYHNDYYILIFNPILELAKKTLEKYSPFYKVHLTDVSDETASLAVLLGITNLGCLKEDLIRDGIPCLYPQTSGLFLPHELNLLDLNAVSLTKGCFTGQEIIARMHYKGKLKSKLHMAKGRFTSPPEPGLDLYSEMGAPIGKIVDYDSVKTDQSSYNEYLLLVVCPIGTTKCFLDPDLTQPIDLTIEAT